jgi:hypothetical protein
MIFLSYGETLMAITIAVGAGAGQINCGGIPVGIRIAV